MNNFTKSSGRAYWHSITNLFCCSPHIKRLQDKSMKAVMLFMFFALGSSAMFAQNPDTGGGFLAGDIDGCLADVPAPPPVDELKARAEFKDCVTSSYPFLLEPIAVINGVDGEWGIASGFSKGSTNCAWTYYYVYTAKCQNAIVPFTVKFNGGDATQPKLKKGAKIPQGATDLNLCFKDIPPAPLTYLEMAALFTDNCSHVKAEELVTLRTKSKQDDCKWIVMYVYTIHDGCTEPIEIVVTYTGGDTENPEFVLPYKDLPHDVSVDCDKIPAPLTLLWGDNCTASNKVKSVDDTSNLGIGCAGGFIVRTWDIKDDCGNTNSHTQKITVYPAPQAYFYDTQDVYIPCADRANAASYIQDLGYTNGRDSQRCGIYGIAKPEFTVPDTSCGDFEVTYSFTDLCGRISTASLTAHIVDLIRPSILVAADDKIVECDGDGNVEQYAAWLANNGGALAEDNCDTDLTWDNDDTSHPFSDDCGATGQKTIVFTVFDDCGNESKTAATFYIVDTIKPSVVPATDKRVQCDGDGNTQQYIDWIASLGGASASDDCSKITWTNNGPVINPKDPYYDNLTDFKEFVTGCSFYVGYVRVTFTATDECGHYTETTADFIIEDSIAPTISTPASDMTVECDGSIGNDLAYLSDAAYGTNNAAAFYDWLYTNGGAIADPDACSEIKWTYVPYADYYNPCDVYYYVTFTVSDVCGNESTTSATFHVVDTNSPAITEEAHDMTVECDGYGNEQEFYAWLNNNAGATAIDLCDDYLDWSNDWSTSKFTDECGATGRVTVLFTVTDNCGLGSTTAAEFVIVDTTKPGIYVPYDVTLDLDDNCSADITPYNTGYATGDDQCGNVTVTFKDVSNKGDCVDVITRTWTVTDACGNYSVGYQYITLKDVSAPVLNPALLPPNMSNLDLCEAPVGPTEAEVAAAFTDNCNSIIVTKSLNVISVGVCDWATQYIYEVKDECGNVYDGLVKISYWGGDISKPQPTLGPLPKDVSKINECLYDAIAANPGADAYKDVLPLFTDNCDLKLDITKSEYIDDTNYNYYPNGCTWAFHYTFTITDDCGNYYSFDQNFSGTDNLAPRLIDPASLINLDLSDIDSCKDTAPDGPSEGFIADLFIECGITPGDGVYVDRTVHITGTDCGWLYSYDYDVYDYCGNHYPSFKVTYTGSDQTAPVFAQECALDVTIYTSDTNVDCPADAYISLKAGDEITVNDTWFVGGLEVESLYYCVYDDCTYMEDLIIRVVETTNTKDSCSNLLTITFEAEDLCGNVSTVPFTCKYTIVDDTDPTGTAPADLIVECSSDVPAANVKDITDEADNCNAVTVTHVGDVSDQNFDPEVITRTYRISDACGNSIDVTQTITVQDKTSPEVTCQIDQDFGVNPVLANGIPAAIPETASYTDNCDPDGVTSTFADVFIQGFEGAYAPGNWAINTGGGDGSVTITPTTLTVVGNNTNTSIATQATITCPTSGAFSFDWDYVTNDSSAFWDPGYYINGVFVQLTNDGGGTPQSGSLTINCVAGDVIGFAVQNFFGGFGAATLTISNFYTGSTLIRTFTQVDASGNVGECSTTYTWYIVPPTPVQSVNSGDLSLSLDFRAYPVPFNKDVNIKYNFDFDTDVTIQVYDTKGLLVLSKTVQGYRSGSDFTLPLSITGADQLYYVKLITNRGTVIKKIVSSNID